MATAPPAPSVHKPPSARDIPPVTLTHIPPVDASEFQPYLDVLGPLYEQLRRVKSGEDEAAGRYHDGGGGDADDPALSPTDGSLRPGRRLSAGRTGTVVPASSFSPTETEASRPSPRRSAEYARGATPCLPPLTAVPAVYFDADFRLQNPRTFDVVTERSEVVPDGEMVRSEPVGTARTQRKALATNAVLQEKLSWYIDTVEVHLLASLAAASPSFFTVLASLRELHAKATDSLDRIRALRNELDVVDRCMASNGLHIVRKRRRLDNLRRLQDCVLQLRCIVDGAAACRSLVDQDDVDQALESVASLEELIRGRPGLSTTPHEPDGRAAMQLRDLRGVVPLQGILADVATWRFRIGRVYEARCLDLLVRDLRSHSETVDTRDVLARWTAAVLRPRGVSPQQRQVVPSHLDGTSRFRSELLRTLTGLHRVHHLKLLAIAYREAVPHEIRRLVRRPLPGASDEGNGSAGSSPTTAGGTPMSRQPQESALLAHHLQALEPGDAEAVLVKIYVGVTETLRRLTAQVRLLLDVASSLDCDSCAAREQAPEVHDAIDLPHLVNEAVDIAQEQMVGLLRVRSEQSTRLSVARFLRFYHLNLGFVHECESVSGRSGTALKTVIHGQIADFVQQHGASEKQSLTLGMESDVWEAADFAEGDAARLDWIVSCGAAADPADVPDSPKLWIPHLVGHQESGEAHDAQPSKGSSRATVKKRACIGKQTFLLPRSAILCLNGVYHFLQLISGIPSMAASNSRSLVSYLHHFVACCQRLVLEGGAVRSAGLTRITSKHIALASRALAFVATLCGHAQDFVRRYAGHGATDSCVVELDEVGRLCHEGQHRMHDKLVEIMSRLARSHAKALKRIDWNHGQKEVHPYMATLAKDTRSLHRILTKTMPQDTVRTVMARVFLDYKIQLGQAFEEVGTISKSGWDSIRLDVEFFQSSLSMIEGFEDAGDHLTAIVKAKQSEIAATLLDAPDAAAETERGGLEEGRKGGIGATSGVAKEPKEPSAEPA
ncbi:hypothetical protein VTK73DRAFT_6337 [Phialemonium thermophilum]|uniref:Vacuolar protein sorting-associated protein 54 C-terminal domain-containing protein n=1 Tax=Phialemonium thermophilum TaxID=223376 RepID=A0ABR3WKC4_9PEZI